MNAYNLFGLKINSEIIFETFLLKKPYKNPDATIKIGVVERPSTDLPNSVQKPFTVFNEDIYYQSIPSIADYLIIKSNEVVIQPYKRDKKNKAIALFFIETILPILLVKNNIFAINASAVNTKHGLYLFSTPKGDGKSSFAAKFFIEGSEFVCDDICILKWDEEKNQFLTKCYHPYLQLWKNMFKLLKSRKEKPFEARPLRQGLFKYSIDLSTRITNKLTPVKGIFLIYPENEEISLSIEPLKGIKKMDTSKRMIHSYQIANIVAKHKALFRFSSLIAKYLDLYQIKRSRLSNPQQIYKFIINEISTKTTQS